MENKRPLTRRLGEVRCIKDTPEEAIYVGRGEKDTAYKIIARGKISLSEEKITFQPPYLSEVYGKGDPEYTRLSKLTEGLRRSI